MLLVEPSPLALGSARVAFFFFSALLGTSSACNTSDVYVLV